MDESLDVIRLATRCQQGSQHHSCQNTARSHPCNHQQNIQCVNFSQGAGTPGGESVKLFSFLASQGEVNECKNESSQGKTLQSGDRMALLITVKSVQRSPAFKIQDTRYKIGLLPSNKTWNLS
jgi:hypothetical protein